MNQFSSHITAIEPLSTCETDPSASWFVRVSFKCDECAHKYHVDFHDNALADKFFAKVKAGVLATESICPLCVKKHGGAPVPKINMN